MTLRKTALTFTLCFFFIMSTGCALWDSSDQDTSADTPTYIKLPSSADEVEAQLASSMADFSRAIDRILGQKKTTFDNTVHALNDALYENGKAINIHALASELSPVDAVRVAAESAYLENETAQRQFFYNTELYQALCHVSETGDALSDTDRKLIDHLKAKFENNGISLSASDQAEFDATSTEISQLQSEFINHVTNDSRKVVFTPEELSGIPASGLSLFSETLDGNFEMDPRQTSHYQAITTYAEDEAARQKAYIAYYSVAKDQNPQILERIVQLRDRNAALLNYPTFADLQISRYMAKSAQTAISFLEDLSSGLSEKFAQEKTTLREMKAAHTKNPETGLSPWDISYYKNRYDKEHFDLDHESMKKYFSLDRCLEGMFATFESVFEIKIEKKPVAPEELWHEDVTMYQVKNEFSDAILGVFYLDLYPREGKYTHFATSFTCNGNTYVHGNSELPAGVLIGNWAKPTDSAPSLLTFSDLTTLFHEFGHTLHLLLMNTTYASLHNNSWDFVEVPSQIAERWCFDSQTLSSFAVNYQDPSDKIPADYTEKIQKSETAFSAMFVRGQIAYAMADLTLHTDFASTDAVDVDGVYKTMAETYFFKRPDDTSGISRLTHLAGGYEAGYYSYLWSLAIVHDLETVFAQTTDGLMDRDTGLRLREDIYEPGRTRDEDETVRMFLGRGWNTEAYAAYLTGNEVN